MIYILLLSLFYSIVCEEMIDPYDVFNAFEDKGSINLRKEGLTTQLEDDMISPEINKKVEYSLNTPCIKLLNNLIQSVNQQLPNKIDDGSGYDIAVTLSILSEEARQIRSTQFSNVLPLNDICILLDQSLSREPVTTIFTSTMNILRYSKSLLTHLLFSFRHFITEQENFILFQFAVTFTTAMYLFIKYRSVGLVVVWLIFWILTVTTYTTYMRMIQEAEIKRETLLSQYNYQIPKECINLKKSLFHKYYEYIFGSTPMEMSNECKQYYMMTKLPAEMEVKLLDAFIETISSFYSKPMEIIFLTAHDVSKKIEARHTGLSHWIVGPFIFPLVLIFPIMLLLCLWAGEISFWGIKIKQSTESRRRFHRNFVEHIAPPEPAPSAFPTAEWVHKFIQLQKKAVSNDQVGNTVQEADSVIDDVCSKQNDCQCSHRKRLYQKLKSSSVLEVKPTTSKTLAVRRSSFS